MTIQKANNIWKFVHSVLLAITTAACLWVGTMLQNGYAWVHQENQFRTETTRFIQNQKLIDERQDQSLGKHMELFNNRQIVENNFMNEISKTNQAIQFIKVYLHIQF